MTIINSEKLIEDLKELHSEMIEKSLLAKKERSSIDRNTFDHGYVMGEEYTYKDAAYTLKVLIEKYTGE